MKSETERAIGDLERFMGTVEDALALPREAAGFIRALILGTGATRGLEIGTSYGYSALWSASALAENGGRLVSIDVAPRKTEAARERIRAGGLADAVEFRTGPAERVLKELDGPFDYVLNDADKENCKRYVELIAERLTDRAVVLTDNTGTHAEELAGFVEWIRGRRDFVSVDVPLGNGMEMSVKRSG
ncbi:MAG: class I SAM-dependent methyltransferase [Phycisphaerae bacterium]|jgi:predicted O-methyltransferase YrrM